MNEYKRPVKDGAFKRAIFIWLEKSIGFQENPKFPVNITKKDVEYYTVKYPDESQKHAIYIVPYNLWVSNKVMKFWCSYGDLSEIQYLQESRRDLFLKDANCVYIKLKMISDKTIDDIITHAAMLMIDAIWYHRSAL